MKKLEIKNPDGSIYWTEHFNNLEMAEKWIDEEKTRPYWKAEFSYSIIDEGLREKTQEEIETEKSVIAERFAAKEQRKSTRKAIDWSKTMTVKQLQDVVKALVEDVEG